MRVSLHLTQDCNLRCRYCYAGAKAARPMSRETLHAAIELIFAELVGNRLAVTFSGGEPLLEPALLQEAVTLVRQRQKERDGLKVRFAVNTNGTVLDAARARLLIEERFHIVLSIDGATATHDAARPFVGGTGSFFAVEKNLDALLALNPYLVTISVVAPQSAAQVPETVELLASRGVRFVSLVPDHTGAWDDASFGTLRRAYQELSVLYEGMFCRGKTLHLNLFDERIRSHVHGGRAREVCDLGDELAIGPDGSIFPCAQFVTARGMEAGTMALGDVRGGLLRQRRAAVVASSKRRPQACRDCALEGRCVNDCSCVSFRTTGRVDEVSGFSCAHERMLTPIVDRAAERLFATKNDLFLRRFYDPERAWDALAGDLWRAAAG